MNTPSESPQLIDAVERAVSKTHLSSFAAQHFFGQNMITRERN